MKLRYVPFFVLSIILLASCSLDFVYNRTRFVLRRDGVDIPIEWKGTGYHDLYFIWLHGGPGQSVTFDRAYKFMRKLELCSRVVYTEQRGQGMSTGHYRSDKLTVEECAKDVKMVGNFLKQTYGKNIHIYVMGHSWGGAVGTALFLDPESEELFDGWINMDGFFDAPQNNKAVFSQFEWICNEQINQGNSVDFWEKQLERLEESDITDALDIHNLNDDAYDAEETLINDSIIYQEEEVYYSFVVSNAAHQDNMTTTALAGYLSAISFSVNDSLVMGFSLTDELHKIHIPTLLLWGKYDMVVPPQLGQLYYDSINSDYKRLVYFEHSGHGLFIQETNAVLREIIDFVNLSSGLSISGID